MPRYCTRQNAQVQAKKKTSYMPWKPGPGKRRAHIHLPDKRFHRRKASMATLPIHHSFPLVPLLINVKRILQQVHLLLHMAGLQPRRHAGAGTPTGIHDMLPVMVLRLVEKSLDPRLGETPRSGVERFLLTPDDVLGVRVHVQVFLELCPGEGVQLLYACDRCVLVSFAGTMLVESGVGLAGAKNNALNLFRWGDGFAMFGVGNDPLEMRFTSKVFEGRSC